MKIKKIENLSKEEKEFERYRRKIKAKYFQKMILLSLKENKVEKALRLSISVIAELLEDEEFYKNSIDEIERILNHG